LGFSPVLGGYLILMITAGSGSWMYQNQRFAGSQWPQRTGSPSNVTLGYTMYFQNCLKTQGCWELGEHCRWKIPLCCWWCKALLCCQWWFMTPLLSMFKKLVVTINNLCNGLI
jgi:hypothetical protein